MQRLIPSTLQLAAMLTQDAFPFSKLYSERSKRFVSLTPQHSKQSFMQRLVPSWPRCLQNSTFILNAQN